VPDEEAGRTASSPAPQRTSRRALLTWLTRGSLGTIAAVCIGQVTRYLSFQPGGETPNALTLGKPSDYASGAATYVPEARAYIGHDSQGLYAVDAVCTHLGCLVEQKPDGRFACPCHGSQFAVDGDLERGPATQGLHHLALLLDQDGRLLVDRSQRVAPTTRLAAAS
jgi:cytochrome b6-f complex iron-sulfur subunit